MTTPTNDPETGPERTVKLATGMSTVTDRTVLSQTEWLEQARALYGPDPTAWRWRCPRCEHVHSGADFKQLDQSYDAAAQECIGRHDSERGCDWAAYGLLGTMGKGVLVDLGGEGDVHVREAFAWADETPVTTEEHPETGAQAPAATDLDIDSSNKTD